MLDLIVNLARAQSNEEACQFLLDALASSIRKIGATEILYNV